MFRVSVLAALALVFGADAQVNHGLVGSSKTLVSIAGPEVSAATRSRAYINVPELLQKGGAKVNFLVDVPLRATRASFAVLCTGGATPKSTPCVFSVVFLRCDSDCDDGSGRLPAQLLSAGFDFVPCGPTYIPDTDNPTERFATVMYRKELAPGTSDIIPRFPSSEHVAIFTQGSVCSTCPTNCGPDASLTGTCAQFCVSDGDQTCVEKDLCPPELAIVSRRPP